MAWQALLCVTQVVRWCILINGELEKVNEFLIKKVISKEFYQNIPKIMNENIRVI